MKIKKLSILGFKSFMDRLQIIFPVGICGIVGPNGCGKSNIVDAIRWCLGEQSPKQLRGRRMEDVIFSGAGDFKSLGMAEVSIVFENGDGSFPPAFANDTEMSVTRRLYRSGESEYLINNVSCRLKDIHEVFMDTGLGNRAYSIIGQGKIGSILEQRPEETRLMLEEAAGITKYRKKVEASQKKIELTEANLQRVEDILREVQGQMRSLKRQASKAKRYKAIGQEIQELELILYSNIYHQYKGESGSKLRSSEDLVQKEIARSTALSGIHAGIETMNLELEEKDAALAMARKDHFRLSERVHKKEAGLGSLDREIRMQEELERRLREEEGEIRERLKGLEAEKVRILAEIEKMKGGSLKMGGEISLREKRLGTRQQMLKQIKEAYEKARSELSAGENKEVGLNHESGYLNKMVDQITDSRSRLEKEIQDVQSKTRDVINASDRKSEVREATAERLRDIEDSIENEKMSCEELEQIKKRVETELRSKEADLNACQSRLTSLQALTDNFEGYKMGVRTIMKAKDLPSRREGRILGLVAEIIQVDPKHEQAVEAVLADKLQYIIVESQEDARSAVEYLKDRAKGRGSFIPLKDLGENGKGQAKASRFPRLSDLVSASNEYMPLINSLLGDTVLVEDLKEAFSAWRENGRDLHFVTIDGDTLDRRGVISGGRLAQSSRGLLARKREIAELKDRSVGYSKEVDDFKLELDNIMFEIQEKRDGLEGLNKDKRTRQEEINEYDKMLFRLGQELDQLEKMFERLTADLERKEIEQRKHNKELSRIEQELHLRKERHRKEEEYFRKKEEELKECEQEFDKLREELAKLKADYRIFEEEQRGLAREVNRLDDYVDDSLKRLQKIEEDIAQGHRQSKVCQGRQVSLKEELEEVRGKLSGAEEAVKRADQERQVFQGRIRGEESKAEGLREEIEGLKEEINRTRMEHSEIRYKMNNLGEMVREKFNLELDSIYEKYLDEGFSAPDVEARLERQKGLRQGLGEVNLTAIKEHEALKERHDFILTQREDLISSIDALRVAIRKINRTSLEKFRSALHDVDEKLRKVFPILFNGGTAGLRLIDDSRPLESGVLVEVQPPGKRLSHMGLLSGGEKALVAMALLFAIYLVKPSPFCLLDEVDAPLDEANIDRFNDLLQEIKRASQIIMVTHSRRTMEIVDRLYGITMERPGMSSVVSVDIQGVNGQASDGPADVHPTVH